MAWIRKHSGARGTTYRVHWRDPAGVEHSETFARRTGPNGAEAFARDVEGKKDRGRYRDPKAGQEPFGAYCRRFLASAIDLRPATRALYDLQAARHVLPHFGAMPVASIRPADVRGFVAKLQDGGAGAPTIQVAHRLLRRVLAQAVADDLIPANPAARAKTPRVVRKPPRILTAAELEGLADVIDPRYRALVLLCGYGGLRFGEASGLRRGSLHVLERRVDVVEALAEVRGELILGPTKTSSPRSVSIPRSLAKELGAHMARFMRPAEADRAGQDLVFADPKGGPIRRTNWRRRFWSPAVEAAGLVPVPTPHDLRHTAAAVAIAQGAHPKAIQARLGHSSIRTTLDVYGSLFPNLDADLADSLDAVRRKAAREARAERLRNDRESTVVDLRTARP